MMTIVLLLTLPILGLVEAIGRWLPSHLVGALGSVPAGTSPSEYLRSAAVTVALVPLLLWLSVRWAQSREL